MVQIDHKYSVAGGEIVNTLTGKPLNPGEPRVLFRARDVLAAPLLREYRALAVEAKCTPEFIREIDEIIDDFEAYKALAPRAMKVPD